jgi:hypothetical protein
MTRTHASQTDVRSILDRASMDYEQMYRKRHEWIRTHRTDERRKQRPTEDDSSGVRAND